MGYIIIVLWSLWLLVLICWIKLEKATKYVYHSDTYPRDERGRITGRKDRKFYHVLEDGRHIPFDIIGYPFVILIFINFVLTTVYFANPTP